MLNYVLGGKWIRALKTVVGVIGFTLLPIVQIGSNLEARNSSNRGNFATHRLKILVASLFSFHEQPAKKPVVFVAKEQHSETSNLLLKGMKFTLQS